jgi:hypothetical protein
MPNQLPDAGYHTHCTYMGTCVRNIYKNKYSLHRNNRFLQNVGTRLPNYTASRSTAFRPSYLQYFVHSLFLKWKRGDVNITTHHFFNPLEWRQ